MKVAFLFPGQGSQYPEMLDKLPQLPIVSSLLDQASSFLRRDVKELDSESELQSAVSVQIALFVAAAASAQAIQSEGVQPHAVAGLSVGAYAAAFSSGSISFLDGLAMVKKRAELMHDRFPKGYGMTVIAGLTEQKLTQLVTKNQSDDAPIFVSNINAPLQITLSGSLSGLSVIENAALANGARKADRLPVTVPSHCKLYEEVSQQLLNEFASVKLSRPNAVYISNVGARSLRSPEAILNDLANNIAHGVRWNDSMTVLSELGTELFVEMPPGNVLTRLVCDLRPSLRAVALDQTSISYVKGLVDRQ